MSTQIVGGFLVIPGSVVFNQFWTTGSRAFLASGTVFAELPVVNVSVRQNNVAQTVINAAFRVPDPIPNNFFDPQTARLPDERPELGDTRFRPRLRVVLVSSSSFRTTLLFSVAVLRPPPVPDSPETEDPPVVNPSFPSDACAPVPTVIEEVPVPSPCSSGAGGTAGPRSFF